MIKYPCMEGLWNNIRKLLTQRGSVSVGGLKGSSGPFLSSVLYSRGLRPLVILVRNPSRAEDWARDLRFFCPPETEIEIFPSWEVLPFDRTSPFLRIQSKRLQLLRRMLMGQPPDLMIVPAEAWLMRTVPREWLETQSLFLFPGQGFSQKDLVLRLEGWGYQRVPLVEEVGDYSVRGGIVDIFPPEMDNPVRVDFLGDEIESLRNFSPDTQRSMGKLQWVEIPPVKEIPWSEGERRSALTRLWAGVSESHDLETASILESLAEGILFPGAEFLLPYFHQRLGTIKDYLPESATLILEDASGLEAEMEGFWNKARLRGQMEGLVIGRLVKTEDLYADPREAFSWLDEFRRLDLRGIYQASPKDTEESVLVLTTYSHEGLREEFKLQGPMFGPTASLTKRLTAWLGQGLHVHWVMRSQGQALRVRDHLEQMGLSSSMECPQGHWPSGPPRIWIRVGELSQGFCCPQLGLVLLTEEEVFGPALMARHHRKPRRLATLTHLEDLKEGDLIVHVDHGIGIYRGLRTIEVGGFKGDFLQLEYLGGDRLYVPVERLQSVHKYLGTEGILPRLDRLGGSGWESRKRKVEKAIQRMAKELLELYATREVIPGHAFSAPDEMYEEFARGFPYEETPDQRRAIEDVMADMGSPKPMDRIVCGDVGFGKTEVAMRAAFRAVMDGKQVAYLVPTTLLAEQQYRAFVERFRGYPVIIEVLSRFRTPAEQRAILDRCSRGEIDILIGTHRLLQRDVSFRDLGLLILDEEHRFGVAQKERLKKLKKQVDVLTLTATPIPRTLHMALVGIRDLSIIETPPPERLSIKTIVAPFEESIVREAVERELARGGQVFFVHNRVQGIESIANTLRQWLPNVRMGVAHGQMAERELERVMDRFRKGGLDVLVCTTIIEAGLDIPTANTILINEAHKLGLAEMHQIRGRVGRSGHQAYAYLLLPDKKGELSPEALRRLESLQEFSELGAGFQIATRDLEIRGAGTLLGPSQSGHIDSVGFELYTQLMQRAVATLRGEPLAEEIEPEIQIPLNARIPETYVPDPHQRLALYRRLTKCQGNEELSCLREEMQDRYGSLPEEAENLIHLLSLKGLLRVLGIRRLSLEGGSIKVTFHPTTRVSPQRILKLLQDSRLKGMVMVSEDTLLIPVSEEIASKPLALSIKDRLKELFLDASIAA